jgi:hypothetical protein
VVTLGFIVRDRYDLAVRCMTEVIAEVKPDHLVIVDNASTDPDLLRFIAGLGGDVIRNKVNRGIAPARNQLMAAAVCADVFVMVDPDLSLPPGWFSETLRCISVPEVMVASVNAEGTEYEIATIDGVRMQVKPGNIAGVWVFPKRTLNEIGYFSEDYHFYGGEDSDYGSRIHAAGGLSVYAAGMSAVHLGHEDGLNGSSTEPYAQLKRLWWQPNMTRWQQYHAEYESGTRPLKIEKPGIRLVSEARPGIPLHYQPEGFCVEIGPGPCPVEGFVHVDAVQGGHVEVVGDLTQGPLPFPDDSVDRLYSSHFLEHLPWTHVPQVLADFARIIRPGGTIELHVPDMAKCLKAPNWTEVMLNLFGGMNHEHDVHMAGFRPKELRAFLIGAGFRPEPIDPIGDYDIGMAGVRV